MEVNTAIDKIANSLDYLKQHEKPQPITYFCTKDIFDDNFNLVCKIISNSPFEQVAVMEDMKVVKVIKKEELFKMKEVKE